AFGPGLHKVIHRPKPSKTIKRHNGPKLSPDQTGYGSEAARQTKGFQRTFPQHSGSPLGKPKEYEKRQISRCSRSPRPSVFSRIKRDRSRSPRQNSRKKEGGVFKRLGNKGKSVSARSDSHNRHSYSKYTKALSESEDSEGEDWKSRSKKRKSSIHKDRTMGYANPVSHVQLYADGKREGEDEGIEGPMIIEAEIGGHCIHRIYMDGGSASEILYEHFFNRLRPEIKNQLMPATTPLIGFSSEIIWPIGQIQLLVKIEDEKHSIAAWMNFVVVRSPSPYNGIIGRPGVRKLQAVSLTAHRMLKLLVEGGVITLKSSRLVPLKCAMVSGPEGNLSATKQIVEERVKVPADITDVPRHIAEHRLNIREGCPSVRQKKIGQVADRNQSIQEEVGKLVELEDVRRFQGLKQSMPKRWLSATRNRLKDEHVTTTYNDPLLSGLGDQEEASKHKRMIVDLDANEGVALVDETQGRNDQDMFDTSILDNEEVVAEREVSTADPVITTGEVVTTAGIEVRTTDITSQISMDEITLAKALIDIKTSKPKATGIVIQEPNETPTPTPIDSSQYLSKAEDKGKAKMIEPKKPLKRKDQIIIYEEVARNLEA
nr:reverse transcriptase domain-containing protein [Tanacetum cinerariifolium]